MTSSESSLLLSELEWLPKCKEFPKINKKKQQQQLKKLGKPAENAAGAQPKLGKRFVGPCGTRQNSVIPRRCRKKLGKN